MDDVWDDEAQEPGETRKIEREHNNAGYLEGVTAAKKEAHQPGFDEGYEEGAEIGIRVGRIIGSFQGLGLEDFEQSALKELSAPELFRKPYFNEEARPQFQGTDHPLILKWEARLAPFMKDTDSLKQSSLQSK